MVEPQAKQDSERAKEEADAAAVAAAEAAQHAEEAHQRQVLLAAEAAEHAAAAKAAGAGPTVSAAVRPHSSMCCMAAELGCDGAVLCRLQH